MGLIERALGLIFGNGRNVLADTIEVFRENAEAGSERSVQMHDAVLRQFGAEFAPPERGLFDRMMDGVNRLPRPALAMGTLGLFVAAMVDPIWFAARMQGIALVPEPLWWLLGAIVSFYFGARHQLKGQEFQQQLSNSLAKVPLVLENLGKLEQVQNQATTPGEAQVGHDAKTMLAVIEPSDNAALAEWMRGATK